MSDADRDQASGLRRLLTRDGMRVVTFAAACRGAGTTTAIVNIAAALGLAGRHVLIIDEHAGPNNASTLLGCRPRLDLRHATQNKSALAEVMVPGAAGTSVLPAGAGANGLPSQRQLEERRLLEELSRLGQQYQMAFIDAHDRRVPGLLNRESHDVVLVVTAAASAVTGAYGMIKRYHAYGDEKRFHIVVTDVGREAVAELVFGNLQRAARKYLGISVSNLGWVPRDGAVQTAFAQRKPVVTAIPDAPSALGFERVAASMAGWHHSSKPERAWTRPPARIASGFQGLAYAGS